MTDPAEGRRFSGPTMSKVGIFLPCFNVEKSLGDVLASFTPDLLGSIHTVLLVDNHSTDGTFDLARHEQSSGSAVGRKLVIIRNRENYGLGGSHKIAFRYFLDHGFDHFMVIHGDNQGDGNLIAATFLEYLALHPDVDVVSASRFTRGSRVAKYSTLRVIGNLFFNVLTRCATGLAMSDAGTGIQLFKTSVLRELPFEQLQNFFHFNPQLNILLHERKNLELATVPLAWRDSESASNVRALAYCSTLTGILCRYGFSKYFLRKSGASALDQPVAPFVPQYDVYPPES